MPELIVAFDAGGGREALALADRLPGLRWAKIGAALYVREGPALVRAFGDRGVRVFLDLKWHDIPHTVAQAVAAGRAVGVAMATVHCLGGPGMLRAAAAAAGTELALVGVTLLTSHTVLEVERVLGRGVPDVGVEVERLARSALGAGLRGVVASGAELALLRRVLGADHYLVVPGIRRAADPPDDQARTVAPGAAAALGATHIVVGRPITRALDPAAVYQEIMEEACTPGGS